MPRRYLTGLSRSTAFLALASFFADVSTELLYPVLPVFLTQTLGAGGSIVGLVEGIATATQNVVQGVSGWLSDRFRRRRPIALAGYTVAALAKPLIGLSSAWPGVLGARFLDRLGTGLRSAPRDALVAGSVDEPHRGKAFGLEGLGDNLGAFVGPLLAVFLLSAFRVNLRTIFYVATFPGLLSVCMMALVRERGRAMGSPSRPDAETPPFPEAYWRYLLVTGLAGIGNSSNSFLILRVRDTGVSLQATILIYAAFNLVAALISYPAGFLSDRVGGRNLLGVSFALFGLAYLGFGVARGALPIVSLFLVYGLSQGTVRPVGKALATDFAPQSRHATALGWYNAVTGLSGLIASLVAGQLWDRVGHAAVFFYGAVFAAGGLLALLALVPARTSRA